MSFKTGMGARLGFSGTLIFKNKQGEVIKTTPFSGAIPLERLGLTQEQAQQLVEQQDRHQPSAEQPIKPV